MVLLAGGWCVTTSDTVLERKKALSSEARHGVTSWWVVCDQVGHSTGEEESFECRGSTWCY